jgi:hypothetical protein
VIARFLGKDNSCGFRYGRIYNIKTCCERNYITLSTLDNKHKCIHGCVEAVLANWKIYNQRRLRV